MLFIRFIVGSTALENAAGVAPWAINAAMTDAPNAAWGEIDCSLYFKSYDCWIDGGKCKAIWTGNDPSHYSKKFKTKNEAMSFEYKLKKNKKLRKEILEKLA